MYYKPWLWPEGKPSGSKNISNRGDCVRRERKKMKESIWICRWFVFLNIHFLKPISLTVENIKAATLKRDGPFTGHIVNIWSQEMGFTLLGEKHQELKVKESNQKPQGCNKVTNKATGSWRLGYELCSLVGVGYQSRRSVDECFHGCRWGARASCWPDSLSCSHMTGNRSDCVTGVFSHHDVATNVFTARNSLQCATWMQRVW